MNKQQKILAYIRVSKDSQDVQNQELEILRYCQLHALQVTHWIKVTVSSRQNTLERRIEELLTLIKREQYTTLLVTEVSRLSRTIGELLFLLEKLEVELHVEVLATKDAELNNLPQEFKLMRRIFAAYFAQEERRIISLRTREALQSRREAGVLLGKPLGTIQASIYDPKLTEIQYLLAKQIPLTNISKLLGIGKPLSLRIYLRKRKLL